MALGQAGEKSRHSDFRSFESPRMRVPGHPKLHFKPFMCFVLSSPHYALSPLSAHRDRLRKTEEGLDQRKGEI